MSELNEKDIQLIMFLCFQRKSIVGLDECDQEGTSDLYRKCCAILRDEKNE